MTELTLEALRAELAPIRAQLDGLPLINRAIEVLRVLRHDIRAVRGAINDLAAIQVTAGEIQALHDDVNRVLAQQAELEARLATLERLTKS